MNFRNKKILSFLLLVFVHVSIIYPVLVETMHSHSEQSVEHEHQEDCQCGCHGEMARCMCHTAAIGIVGFSYCNHEMNTLFPLFTPFFTNVLKGHEMEILRNGNSINLSTNDRVKSQEVVNLLDPPPRFFLV